MVEAEKKKLTLEAWLMVALLVSVVLSTVVIAVVSSNKTTVFHHTKAMENTKSNS